MSLCETLWYSMIFYDLLWSSTMFHGLSMIGIDSLCPAYCSDKPWREPFAPRKAGQGDGSLLIAEDRNVGAAWRGAWRAQMVFFFFLRATFIVYTSLLQLSRCCFRPSHFERIVHPDVWEKINPYLKIVWRSRFNCIEMLGSGLNMELGPQIANHPFFFVGGGEFWHISMLSTWSKTKKPWMCAHFGGPLRNSHELITWMGWAPFRGWSQRSTIVFHWHRRIHSLHT